MRVLIVEDDATLCKLLTRSIEGEFSTVSFTSPASALAYLSTSYADVIVSDIRMPGMTGLQLLQHVQQEHPETRVILITGFGTIEESVSAMKAGAHDYILKPVDVDILRKKLRTLRELLESRLNTTHGDTSPVFASRQMQELMELTLRAARTDTSVLLQGETGTGKEVLARTIHQSSPRCERPFVAVNCCNLQENLFESELFGYRKGAFTGADRNKPGLISMAEKGTLFLDEIGEMPLSMQGKFLRFLEERSYYPVGSEQPEKSDIRIITATNRNLEQEAAKNSFRRDLLYRLNVLTISIPPLRERTEDIIPLAYYFLGKFRHINPAITSFSPEAEEMLSAYHFPGNVRELENIVERALIIERTPVITPRTLNLSPVQQEPDGRKLDDVIRTHILTTLDACDWNRTKAAELLGIDASTIYRKLKEYGAQSCKLHD